jgi:hypothetical protein
LIHNSDNLCELWHRRLGHLHNRALSIMREIVTSLPEFNIEQQGVCRGFALGNNVKVAFPSNKSRSKEILDLVHLDVSGLLSVASLQRSSYYVTFIDDFSRKAWIFFRKIKDEVFSWFREFRAQVENHTRMNIKVLKSNNGGEYTSNDFEYFYKSEGIKRELTISYNPQQNGVVERKNRSIISSAKAMVHDQELPMFLWEEACNKIVYV